MLGGILSSMIPAIAGFAGSKIFPDDKASSSFVGDIGNAVGGAIPLMNGKEMGRNVAKFNKHAYPGTTPWEQLGGSAGGAIGSASVTTKAQERMQDKALDMEKYKADQQALVGAITAGANAGGAPGMDAALSALNRKPFQKFTHSTSLMERQIPSIIAKNNAQARRDIAQAAVSYQEAVLTGHKGTIQGARAKLADKLANDEVTKDLPSIIKALRSLERDEMIGSKKSMEDTKVMLEKLWSKIVRIVNVKKGPDWQENKYERPKNR